MITASRARLARCVPVRLSRCTNWKPAPGLKASRVIGLADDIARSMSALSARVSTVPGRSVIGIELPNAATARWCYLRELLASEALRERHAAKLTARARQRYQRQSGRSPNLAKYARIFWWPGTTGSGQVRGDQFDDSLVDLSSCRRNNANLILIDPEDARAFGL